MLKRKLHKAGLIVASFAIMASSSGKNLGHNVSGFNSTTCSALPDSTSVVSHSFDSAGLCVCLHMLPAEDLDDAPRIKLNRNAVTFVNAVKKQSVSLEKIKSEKGAVYFTLIDTVLRN